MNHPMPRVSRIPFELAVARQLAGGLPASVAEEMAELGLDRLMNITVTGAAKSEQKQNEVAAAASIVTREEIKAFGWRRPAEVPASLRGVKAGNDRQCGYVGMRGFGPACLESM